MTFLNATLIFGTLAAVVPIVLHLIARREPRKIVFPSIRFLTKRFESNRTRLRVRRWWLLALRIAVIAALALALARPAIHQSLSVTWLTIGLFGVVGIALLVMASVAVSRGQSRGLTIGLAASAIAALLASAVWGTYTFASGPAIALDHAQPVAIAIVLDNSPTSAWQTSNDNHIERMQDLATWMTARLPRTSRIAVIDRSSQPAAFSIDVTGAVAKIEQTRPLQVTEPISSRIDAAARLVRTSDLTNRQILLITDLSESTWDESVMESGLADTLGQEPAVSLTIYDLGNFDSTNRSLSIPSLADPTPPRGVPVTLSTTLQMVDPGGPTDEPSSPSTVTAELQMFQVDPSLPVVRDGKVAYPELRSVDRTSVRVPSGGSSELLLTIPGLEIGTHHGLIRLTAADAMPLDDVRFFSLQVLPPSSLLLVSDDDDEARIIRQAITASAVMTDDMNAEFLVERIGFADLSVARLSDFETIVMLDPPRAALEDSAMTEFVNQGGTVFVSLGPAAGNEAVESLLVPKLLRRWRAPDEGTFFHVTNVSHLITTLLASNTPWSDFRVRQYWQVEPTSSDAVLIRYAGSNNPAMVERTFPGGNRRAGRSVVLTTPIPSLSKATRSWNDLFDIDPWPAWLLTRQTIEYLAGRGEAGSMSLVGQPQTIQLGPESAERSQRLQLFPPGGAPPVPLDLPEDAPQGLVTDVPRAGTYWVRGDVPGIGFSANLAPAAINLGRIDAIQLDAIFGPDRYALVADRNEIELADDNAAGRVSLYSPAMLLALIAFLLEQVLGNRFYRSGAS